MSVSMSFQGEGIARLSRAERQAAATIGEAEARYLVDQYYQVQDFRKATANQTRAQLESDEPFVFHHWLTEQFTVLEKQICGTCELWKLTYLFNYYMCNV